MRREPIAERDPLFARYKAAWTVYLTIQADRPGESVHFRRAVSDPTDPTLQAAAVELTAARNAWLADPSG